MQNLCDAVRHHIQLLVRDGAVGSIVAFPVVGHFGARGGLHKPVEAIIGNVQLAAGKPLEERLFSPFKGSLPRFEPVQFLRQIFPILEAMSQ